MNIQLNAQITERKNYLDNIRWITVFIVVIYHVIYMFNAVQPYGVIGPLQSDGQESILQYQDAFQYLVYPWFMALLFVVSGMSARYDLQRRDVKAFLKARHCKLLVPSTIGLFVFHWTTGYFNLVISNALESMTSVPKPVLFIILSVSGTGPLWYIQMLWFFSLILIPVMKLEKGRLLGLCEKTSPIVLVLFAPLAFLFAQILNTPVVTVYRFGLYGFCFFVGYFVMSHEAVMDKLEKLWLPLDLIAAGLGIAYTVIYFGQNYALEPVVNCPLACIYCWFAILAIFATMRKFGDVSNRLTRWMNRKSWGLYLFHYLPLAASAYGLHKYTPNMPALLVYLLVALSAFFGALILDAVLSRIPVIRFCVLGKK